MLSTATHQPHIVPDSQNRICCRCGWMWHSGRRSRRGSLAITIRAITIQAMTIYISGRRSRQGSLAASPMASRQVPVASHQYRCAALTTFPLQVTPRGQSAFDKVIQQQQHAAAAEALAERAAIVANASAARSRQASAAPSHSGTPPGELAQSQLAPPSARSVHFDQPGES